MIGGLLISIILSYCLWKTFVYWWSNRNFYELASKIPATSGNLPLIGQAHKLIGIDSKALYKLASVIISSGAPSPRIFWIAQTAMVVVDHPDQVQQVLSSRDCIDRPNLYNGLCSKEGLLILNGASWKSSRKLLDPSFNATTLKSFFPTFNKNSRTAVKVLQNYLNKGEFNIFENFAPLALDNILATSTGIKIEVQTNADDGYLDHVYKSLHVFVTKVFNSWMQIEPLYKLTKTCQMEQKHFIDGVQKFSKDIIEQNERKITEDSSDESKVFINQLLKMRNEFNRSQMVDHTTTMVLTGFETVAITMSSFVLLMGIYPEIQEKVFQELQSVFQTRDEEVTDEKINELVYLDLTLKETMRFLTVVPYLARLLTEDTQIGPKVVPRGANVVIPIEAIHNDKRIWGEDADQFKPERFLPENFQKIHTFGYLPFSRGPRNCIGYSYGLKSVKIAIAHILRSYTVATTMKINELQFEYVIVSKLVQGYKVSLTERDFKSK